MNKRGKLVRVSPLFTVLHCMLLSPKLVCAEACILNAMVLRAKALREKLHTVPMKGFIRERIICFPSGESTMRNRQNWQSAIHSSEPEPISHWSWTSGHQDCEKLIYLAYEPPTILCAAAAAQSKTLAIYLTCLVVKGVDIVYALRDPWCDLMRD